MGHTHYWKRKEVLEITPFRDAMNDCQKLCKAVPIPLGDACGKGTPVFTDNEICFNGNAVIGNFTDVFSTGWPSNRTEYRSYHHDGSRIIFTQSTLRNLILGRAAEGCDGSYETFHIPRVLQPFGGETDEQGLYFCFCKTGHRPYDLLVQACLIVFRNHLGEDFLVFSDGDDADWQQARAFCLLVLGYGIYFRLEEYRS